MLITLLLEQNFCWRVSLTRLESVLPASFTFRLFGGFYWLSPNWCELFFNFLCLCTKPYCSTSAAENVRCQGKYDHLTGTLQFRVGGTPGSSSLGVVHHAGSHGLWGHPRPPTGGTMEEPAGSSVPAQHCQQLWHTQEEHKRHCLDPVNQWSFLLQLLCSTCR